MSGRPSDGTIDKCFGSWAVCMRPLALRPRLATGLPFRSILSSARQLVDLSPDFALWTFGGLGREPASDTGTHMVRQRESRLIAGSRP